MSRDVYPPSEDTELLIAALRKDALDGAPAGALAGALVGARAADVGTGSGAVGVALREMGARVVAVDISPLAAQAARGHGLDVVRGDLTSALRGPFDVVEGAEPSTSRNRRGGFRGFDVVAFNAPYLPSEPEERVEGWLDHAFHGGEGGIEVSARFIADLPRVLAPGGRGYLVVSSRADLPRLRDALPTSLVVTVLATQRFFFEELQVWKLS